IKSWVSDGGAIMINLEDYGEFDEASSILEDSGIALSANYSYGDITSFSEHQITEGVDLLRAYSRSYVTNVTGTAQTIARNREDNGFVSIDRIGDGRVMIAMSDLFNYNYSDGNIRFIHNSIRWLLNSNGLSIYPDAGVVAGGDESTVQIVMEAGKPLGAGQYDWDLVINHNAPDSDSITVPVSIEILATGLLNAPDNLEFPPIPIGLPRTAAMSLQNTGSDSLLIESVTSDNNLYELTFPSGVETPFKLAPEQNIVLSVTFSPTNTEEEIANVVITTDSEVTTTKNITVTGSGLNSVILSAAQDQITEEVAIGETKRTTLTINNEGTEEGTFSILIANGSIGNAVEEIRQEVFGSQQTILNESQDLGGNQVRRTLRPEQVAGTVYSNSPQSFFNVAVLGGGTYFNGLIDSLQKYNRFASITFIDISISTPGTTQLANFDAVLLYNTFDYANATSLGDALADYVDAGRGVVYAPAQYNSGSKGLFGRWANGDYKVFDGNQTQFENLTTTEFPEHPITEGITQIVSGNKTGDTELFSDGEVLGRFSDNTILLAEKEIDGVKRVDLGIYPEDMFYTTLPDDQHIQMMLNALDYVAELENGSNVSWVEFDQYEGTVPASGSMEIGVTLSGVDLEEDIYDATIRFTTNNSQNSTFNIPLTLTTIGTPDVEFDDQVLFESSTVGMAQTAELDLFNKGSVSNSSLLNVPKCLPIDIKKVKATADTSHHFSRPGTIKALNKN
ncbi:MAG: hypothetical protein AAFO69_15570, partial [Bacteroidota bacterium]